MHLMFSTMENILCVLWLVVESEVLEHVLTLFDEELQMLWTGRHQWTVEILQQGLPKVFNGRMLPKEFDETVTMPLEAFVTALVWVSEAALAVVCVEGSLLAAPNHAPGLRVKVTNLTLWRRPTRDTCALGRLPSMRAALLLHDRRGFRNRYMLSSIGRNRLSVQRPPQFS